MVVNRKEYLISIEGAYQMIDLATVKDLITKWAHLLIINGNGKIEHINERFTEITGFSKEEVVNKSLSIIYSNEQLEARKDKIKSAFKQHGRWQGTLMSQKKDGTFFGENVTIVPYLIDGKTTGQYLLVGVETPTHQVEEAQSSLDSFQKMIQHLENTIFKYVRTRDDRIVFTLSEGKIAERIGFVTEVIQNREVKEFFPDDVWPVMEANFRKALHGKAINFEMHLLGTDFLVYLSPIIEEGTVIEVVGTAIDITERKKHEALINYMAYHDSLTGLLNRPAFHDALREEVEAAKTTGATFAVLFLDLNRFKIINDTLGHRMGDRLLVAVAERLKKTVAESDVVARLGGDEYAMILSNRNQAEIEETVQYLIAKFSEPFMLENHELYTMPSIGISFYPKDGEDENVLLNHADLAMYHAKADDTNHYSFFTADLREQIQRKELLESELIRALKNDEFVLYYQPQVNMETREVFGVEALIRWKHPERGLVFPGDFIPIAEETGLIVPIGEWVLREASEQNKAWQQEGYDPIVISVNVAPQQFMKSNFIETVEHALAISGLSPEYLELEITESATIDVNMTKNLLTQLDALGVKVSIDDFGTGYSSLNYLSQLSINKLKIDQSFIRGMDDKNEAIVKTIISLAKNLNMDVIAEGVEMSQHVDFLTEQNCHRAQGYFFSKPLPKQDFVESFLLK